MWLLRQLPKLTEVTPPKLLHLHLVDSSDHVAFEQLLHSFIFRVSQPATIDRPDPCRLDMVGAPRVA